jgi:DNA-directed RNA polymerase specialized sigma24 family protein
LGQETYVRALKRFSSFQLGTNFRAWMYRILRNTFLTSREGLKVAMTVPLDPKQEEEPEPAVEHDTGNASVGTLEPRSAATRDR